jgi:hypothetical protein
LREARGRVSEPLLPPLEIHRHPGPARFGSPRARRESPDDRIGRIDAALWHGAAFADVFYEPFALA